MKLSGDAHRLMIKRIGLIALFSAASLAVAIVSRRFPGISNASTSAFCLLIIVLIAAFFGDAVVGIVTSVASALCFDYFCLPPYGTFTITAFPDSISFVAFLLTSVVIGRLTASAAQHAAAGKRSERVFAEIKEFESRLLLMPAKVQTLSKIAEEALRAFSLEYCSIHAYSEGKWYHCTGSAMRNISEEIEKSGLKLFRDHPTDLLELAEENMLGVMYARINIGATPHVLLAVKSDSLPFYALGAVAGIIGLRISETSARGTTPEEAH